RSSSATSCGGSVRPERLLGIACDSRVPGRRIASAVFRATASPPHEGAHQRRRNAARARRPPSEQRRRVDRRSDDLGRRRRPHLPWAERRARRGRVDREVAGAPRIVTLLAHAITAAPPAALSPEGLRGRPLAWSEAAAGLGLWSTDWTPDLKLERPDALEHHRLVERICAAPPCLPGRRYMEQRRAELGAREAKRARAESMVERIVTELAIERPLVWHETCTTANVAVSLAVLVPTERALDRKAELGRIASEFGDVITVLNGPWPPY